MRYLSCGGKFTHYAFAKKHECLYCGWLYHLNEYGLDENFCSEDCDYFYHGLQANCDACGDTYPIEELEDGFCCTDCEARGRIRANPRLFNKCKYCKKAYTGEGFDLSVSKYCDIKGFCSEECVERSYEECFCMKCGAYDYKKEWGMEQCCGVLCPACVSIAQVLEDYTESGVITAQYAEQLAEQVAEQMRKAVESNGGNVVECTVTVTKKTC